MRALGVMNLASADPEVHVNVLSTPTGDAGVIRAVPPPSRPPTEAVAHTSIRYGVEESLQGVEDSLECQFESI